ncbi:MAG: hypothetical protein ACPG8W_07210 [Candidatus Promineifilaceae bacterium]
MQFEAPSISQGYEFSAFIHDLQQQSQRYRYPLETYLRSLLALILRSQRNKHFSYTFIAQLFLDAFSQPPIPFDDTWHTFNAPPTALLYGRDDSLPPFAVLRELLLYQIADLRLLEKHGNLNLPDGVPFLGIDSPTGNRWNNVRLDQFLIGCTAAYAEGANLTEAGWEDLAILLWMGQMHT